MCEPLDPEQQRREAVECRLREVASSCGLPESDPMVLQACWQCYQMGRDDLTREELPTLDLTEGSL